MCSWQGSCKVNERYCSWWPLDCCSCALCACLTWQLSVAKFKFLISAQDILHFGSHGASVSIFPLEFLLLSLYNEMCDWLIGDVQWRHDFQWRNKLWGIFKPIPFIIMNYSPFRAQCRPKEEKLMGRGGKKIKYRRKLGRRRESHRQIGKKDLLGERGQSHHIRVKWSLSVYW